MKLLLVEDHKDIAEVIFDYFESTGFTLDYAATGTQGLWLASENPYDCIILDVMLPGMDGLSVCKQLRRQGIGTPIIMLTARDTAQDTLLGLQTGADDYVVKPFDLEVLEARIHAVTRRSNNLGFNNEVVCGPLKLDVTSRQIYREDTLLNLNPTCYLILSKLITNHPKYTTKAELEDLLWSDGPPAEDLLRKHMYQLRKCVDKPFDTDLIVTRPKIGYAIEVNS